MQITIDIPELDEHPEYIGIIARLYNIDVGSLSEEETLEAVVSELKKRFIAQAKNYIIAQAGLAAQAEANNKLK